MKRLLLLAFGAGSLLAVTACGSDGAPAAAPVSSFALSDGATLTSLQQRVADLTYAAATGSAQPIDADCLKAVVAHLSESDASLIVNAKPAATPTLSPAGSALAASVKACLIFTTTTTVTPG